MPDKDSPEIGRFDKSFLIHMIRDFFLLLLLVTALGRRMFAFRFGWIEVVCAIFAAFVGAISPSPRVPAGRIQLHWKSSEQQCGLGVVTPASATLICGI
jgi:hypothetical protein